MLKSLHIQGFRNLSSTEISFSDGVSVFLGNNAQGKTNLLEAIYVLSTVKSFRNNNLYELINHQAVDFHLVAHLATDQLELHCAHHPRKQIKLVCNHHQTNFYNFLGHFTSVLFTPADTYLLSGAPKLRRNYIDQILIKISKSYSVLLNQYHKIIQQRNKLLKQILKNSYLREQLPIWDQKLYDLAMQI